MPTEIRVTGTQELAAALRKLGEAAADRLEACVQAGALIPRNAAREKAPYKTGDYRRKIGMATVEKTKTRVAVAIGPDDVRGPWLEFGTGIYGEGEGAKKQPYVIRPKEKKALFWRGAAHPFRRITHPGIRPHPHLRPAMDENVERINAEIRAAFDAVILEAIR